MKKVICIKKDKWLNFDKSPSKSKDPIFGEICEVSQSTPLLGKIYYDLNGFEARYLSLHFIPLSDICETELAKQREELQTA